MTINLDNFYNHIYFIRKGRREFNISILGGNKGPKVLPMAEIIFENFPAGKPKIVGYEAKWDESSFEYSHTPRSFGVEKTNLKGYARIDFRVDKNDEPFILEINANPCLSPDAGFYAASQRVGYSFKQVVERIIEDVWK